jgi:hypothetical protein
MNPRVLGVLALLTAVVGCEQESQTLPFGLETDEPVTRTLPQTGGTISSSAGATLMVPAGALGQATTFTITPRPAATPVGTVASAYSFLVESTARLQSPATMELRLRDGAPSAWLTSLVVQRADTTIVIPDATLDLTLRTVRAAIAQIGTVTAVLPPAEAVVEPTLLTQDFMASAAAPGSVSSGAAFDRIAGRCDYVGGACPLAPQIAMTEELFTVVDSMRAVFPTYDVAFSLGAGVPDPAGGQRYVLDGGGELSTSLRAVVGRTAQSASVRVVIAASEGTTVTVNDSFTRINHLYVAVYQCSAATARCDDLKAELRRDFPIERTHAGDFLSIHVDPVTLNGKTGSVGFRFPVELR